jgi:hypothetical protein
MGIGCAKPVVSPDFSPGLEGRGFSPVLPAARVRTEERGEKSELVMRGGKHSRKYECSHPMTKEQP